MKIITGKRGSGKTHELVKLSAENNVQILCVCTNPSYILDVAKQLGVKIPAPIPFCKYSNYYGFENVYVDNAGYLLNTLLKEKFGLKTDTIVIDECDVVDLSNEKTVSRKDIERICEEIKPNLVKFISDALRVKNGR